MMPLNPCYDSVNKKDCPHRSTNCRVSCPKWKEYEQQRDAEYERRRADSCFTDGFEDTYKQKLKYIQRIGRRNIR